MYKVSGARLVTGVEVGMDSQCDQDMPIHLQAWPRGWWVDWAFEDSFMKQSSLHGAPRRVQCCILSRTAFNAPNINSSFLGETKCGALGCVLGEWPGSLTLC